MNRGLFRGVAGEGNPLFAVPSSILDLSKLPATLNDLPVGDARVIVCSDEAKTINGMVPGYPGQMVMVMPLINGTITLTHQSTASQREYRFQLDRSINMQIGGLMGVWLYYDPGTQGRVNGSTPGWRVVNLPPGQSGQTAGTYGSATQVAQIQVDERGRLTAPIGNVTITGVVPAAHAASHQVGGADLVLVPNPGGAITGTAAIANTETVVVAYTSAANELAQGTTFMVEAYCTQAGTNAATPTVRIRVGTTTLIGNIAATLTGVVGGVAQPSHFSGLVTVRTAGAGGTIIGSVAQHKHAAAGAQSVSVGTQTGTVAVDTTAASVLIELTFISGNATNTYTFRGPRS